jgi:acyl-CoA thioester hydrolase
MKQYRHKVQYYETDKMGITHHSNYIRWMEEARIDFLGQLGWDYTRLEELGIGSSVLAIDCRYYTSTTFADEISIMVSITEFKGVRLKLYYEMKNAAGDLVCEGRTEHCFVDKNGQPIALKKRIPEFSQALLALKEEEE